MNFRRLRSLSLLVTLATLGSMAACKGPGILSGENVLQAQPAITVNDGGLNPNSLAILPGQVVTFTWFGNNTNAHELQVTGPGSFNQTSPKQIVGSWTVTFPAAGIYNVVDLLKQTNTATITVVAK